MNRTSPLIVTIDGPAGVGKSTLAKRLAASLGVAYLDTGAMFRTLALYLDSKGWRAQAPAGGGPAADDPRLPELLAGCVFTLRGAGGETELLCNGSPMGDAIRSEKAGMMAANIAVLPQVRESLKAAQQSLGAAFSLVAEGRDMGTAVFPGAARKIFLEAEPVIRARRRCLQLKEMGQTCDLAEQTEQIRQRDEQDRSRAIAPLRPAEDAVIIDTSRLNIDEVFAAILRAVCAEGAPIGRAVRRKDRVISYEESLEVLAKCEYGLLATTGEDGWPYAMPLSYALMDGALYFHCALTGHKIDCIARDSRVCFTVVGETQPVYIDDYATYYESVVVRGHALLVTDEKERVRGLKALVDKYLPEYANKFGENVKSFGDSTAVYKITLEQVTGKAKRAKAE